MHTGASRMGQAEAAESLATACAHVLEQRMWRACGHEHRQRHVAVRYKGGNVAGLAACTGRGQPFRVSCKPMLQRVLASRGAAERPTVLPAAPPGPAACKLLCRPQAAQPKELHSLLTGAAAQQDEPGGKGGGQVHDFRDGHRQQRQDGVLAHKAQQDGHRVGRALCAGRGGRGNKQRGGGVVLLRWSGAGAAAGVVQPAWCSTFS